MSLKWQYARIALDNSHHEIANKPLYTKRFHQVLKYHAPGLAPVIDNTGAYHINIDGQAVYNARYQETFGFYEELAAVVTHDNNWLHIDPQGVPAYAKRYQWCGNFQQQRCVVFANDQGYFHITSSGNRVYPQHYVYAGDFREGCAVVCDHLGAHTHIDLVGQPIYEHTFLELDVYHKGYACAKDYSGYFHIDRQGNPIYSQRFAHVSPFYNGLAHVKTFDQNEQLIDHQGRKIRSLCSRPQRNLAAVSANMVGFWRTQTIAAAVQLKCFDILPATTQAVADFCSIPIDHARRLLRALWELALVTLDVPTDNWQLTAQGTLLKPTDHAPAAMAAQIWSTDHYTQWQKLASVLQQNLSPNHHFQQLKQQPSKLKKYHIALSEYAKQDYLVMLDIISWEKHSHVLDVGGSTGFLLHQLLTRFPHLSGSLMDLPEVIALIPTPQRHKNCNYVSHDFFKPWPVQADAIVLARVLHDWSDKQAQQLLLQARTTLKPHGKIYILEMVTNKEQPTGSLLDLNMLVMTGGQERCLSDWMSLLQSSELTLEKNYSLADNVSLLQVISSIA